MRKFIMFRQLIIILFSIFLFNPVYAEQDQIDDGQISTSDAISQEASVNRWDKAQVNVRYRGSDEFYIMHVVFPTDSTKSGVMLGCLDNKLFARLSTEPVNFRDTIQITTKRSRVVRGQLFRDGEEVVSGRWGFYTALNIALPPGRSPAAKIYNAVVKNQSLSFKISGKPEVEIDLPMVDEEFKAFGRSCGVIVSDGVDAPFRHLCAMLVSTCNQDERRRP